MDVGGEVERSPLGVDAMARARRKRTCHGDNAGDMCRRPCKASLHLVANDLVDDEVLREDQLGVHRERNTVNWRVFSTPK